jgi:hypothetical protein
MHQMVGFIVGHGVQNAIVGHGVENAIVRHGVQNRSLKIHFFALARRAFKHGSRV